VACAALREYVERREELIAATGRPREDVKLEVLVTLYAGHVSRHQEQWITAVDHEVKAVQWLVAGMPQYAAMKKRIAKNQASTLQQKRNVNGSLLSYVLQTFENNIMMAALDYLGAGGLACETRR
jgi:hypothetical protein